MAASRTVFEKREQVGDDGVEFVMSVYFRPEWKCYVAAGRCVKVENLGNVVSTQGNPILDMAAGQYAVLRLDPDKQPRRSKARDEEAIKNALEIFDIMKAERLEVGIGL